MGLWVLWTTAGIGAVALWLAVPGDVAWWRVALGVVGAVAVLYAGVGYWVERGVAELRGRLPPPGKG